MKDKHCRIGLTALLSLFLSIQSFAQGPGNVTTNLEMWLKSNAGTFSDAGTTPANDTDGLQQWDDQSNANDASESTNEPIFNNNATDNINFYPSVDFDGTNSVMSISGTANVEGTNLFSIFVVFKREDDTTDDAIIGAGANASDDFAYYITDGDDQAVDNNNQPNEITGTATFTSGVVSLAGVVRTTTTNFQFYANGATDGSGLIPSFGGTFSTSSLEIGQSFDNPFNGDITEILVYDRAVTDATELSRIQSYLALKYGITIDQTVGTDYLASDGTTNLWDADVAEASTYDNDIAGIGHDLNSALSQPEGKSSNSDAILGISGDGEGTNVTPTLTDIADLEFLTWGNNDGIATWTSADAPDGFALLTREWSVQEVTGDVGAVTVAFDVEDTDFDVPALLSGTSYYVIIDTDNDGSLEDETPQQLFDDGSNGDASSSDNVWSLSGINFDNGEEFTLATAAQGPGGLTTNLTLWLDGSIGVTETSNDVSAWADQSAQGNNATQGTGANQPMLVASNMNGNAVIDFDGTDHFMDLSTNAGISAGDFFSVFAVFQRENDADDDAFLGGGNSADDFVYSITSADVQEASNVTNGAVGTATFATNAFGITGVVRTAANNFQFYSAGATDGSGSISGFGGTFNSNNLEIGRSTTDPFNGKIAELIVYGEDKTSTEPARIQSYLAIKYGIPLTTNYLSSGGSTIWDATANASYLNDIAGIGRDDNSNLDQRSSQSVNTGSVVTVANGDITSPSAFSADASFLIWGHDGGGTTFVTTINNGLSGTSNRITRVWRAAETGTVGSVEISIPNSLATGDIAIVVHPSDPTFPADPTRRVANMRDNGSDYEVTIDLANNEYFSFVNATAATVAYTSVVINEVITDPQQDWSTSDFFDPAPAAGTVTDGTDEWIELLINETGLDLTNWDITLTDGSNVTGDLTSSGAFQTSNYLSTLGGTFTNTVAGDYLILGNVASTGSMNDDITITLTDGSSTIDEVSLGSFGDGPSGNANDATDESISRIPNGQDFNDDATDLTATRASLGTTNSPTGMAVINEVVTNPQSDWSTTGFDGTISGGSVMQGVDEWVEIYIASDNINLAGWTIELLDGTDVIGDLTTSGAFSMTNYVATGGGSFTDTRIGDYLVLGNVTGTADMDDDILITLKDASGTTIDEVELGDDPAGDGAGDGAPDGSADGGLSTSGDDEAVVRYPNATDTDVDVNDFIRTIATLGSDNSLTGTVVINEVVTDPQQDWSTNQFNGTNGGDVIDTDDEWIELFISTAGINLTQWTIEMNDGTDVSGELTTTGAFAFTTYTSSGSGSFLSTEVGDFLVLGNPTGDMGDDVQIILRDASGTIVDQVQLGGGLSGDANDESDESICRLPNGTDTDVDAADFTQTPSSMGARNSLTPLPSVGNALDFDGADEYVEIADNDAFSFGNSTIDNAFTIEAWVFFDGLNDNTLISKRSATFAEYALETNSSGDLRMGLIGDAGTTLIGNEATSFSLTTGVWHHVAATYDGSSTTGGIRLYVDSVDVTETVLTTGSYTAMDNTTAPLNFGSRDGASVFLDGRMDEVRIWSVERTQEEICENMFTTVDDGEANLVAYYRFDRATGTLLSDLGSSNLDGTLMNMEDVDWVAAGWDVFAENAAILQNSSATVSSAPSGQLTLSDLSFLNDNGDKILIGHDALDFAEVTTDLPTGTLVTNRYDRSWHVAKNDAAGTTDGDVRMTFNLGAAVNDDYTYFLLGRSGTSGNFSIVPADGISATGTTVAIDVSEGNLNNNYYYTLGRSDEGAGNALNFDDTNPDLVSMGDALIDGASALTVEVWFRATSLSGTGATDIRSIVSKGDLPNDAGAFAIYLAGDGANQNLVVEADAGTKVTSTFEVGASGITTDTWYHLAVTWSDGNPMTTYLDGAVLGSTANYSGPLNDVADNFLIGSSTTVNEDGFEGEIDELRIWSVARSHEELLTNTFQTVRSTDTDIASLEGYYRFNQGIGNNDTNLPDYSGDAVSGTLTNFTGLSGATEISNYVDVETNATASKNRSSYFDNVVIINGGPNTATSDEITLTSTESAGFYLQDTEDFIAFGNDNGAFTETGNDVPTGTQVTNRYEKTWFFNKNDRVGTAGGTFTAAFDLGAAPNPDRTYFFLTRTGTSGDFSIVEVVGTSVSGNVVTFTVDGDDIADGFFTIGRSGSGPGHALDLDGTNDFVTIPNATQLQLTGDITIEAWIRPESKAGRSDLIAKKGTNVSDPGYALFLNQVSASNISIQFQTQNATAQTSITALINLNEWQHVAAVISGGLATIYYNGQKQGMFSAASNLTSSTDNLTFGAVDGGSANYFNGRIDEVKIWADARTELEIQENMHRTLDVTDVNNDNLMAYYRFNQGIGDGNDNLPDHSGNNHNGALTNFDNLNASTATSNWVDSESVVADASSAPALVGPGNALTLDGTSEYVDVPDAASLDISSLMLSR